MFEWVDDGNIAVTRVGLRGSVTAGGTIPFTYICQPEIYFKRNSHMFRTLSHLPNDEELHPQKPSVRFGGYWP